MIFLLVKRKKPAILKWTSPLRSAGLRNAISYNFYGIAGGFLELPRLSLGHSASSHTCSWWTNSKFNFVQNMFTPMIYLYMYNAVDHNKSFLSQQSLIISTLLSSFTLQTQQHLLKISQGTNVTLLPRLNNYLINNNIIINFKIIIPMSCIFQNCILLSIRKKKRTKEGWKLKNFQMSVPFMYNIQSLSNSFPTIFWSLIFHILLSRLGYYFW